MERKVYFWEQNKKTPDISGRFKMKIAVCDSDKHFLTEFKNSIYRYNEIHRMNMVVDCFVAGESILKNHEIYSLIFLGFSLKGINGFDTAIKLREKHSSASLVFVSDNTDFIFDAFKVEAYRFLTRPLGEKDIFAVLDDFFAKLGKDYPLWIKSREDTVCLNTNDIFYIEADNKHCRIHLRNEILECNRTMAKVFKVLPKNHFCKTNRAFVVNFNRIKRYNNDLITLENDEILHPSRNYYKNFKDEYRRFLRPYEL